MRPIALALSLTLAQPCSLALAGDDYVYLIAPMQNPTPDATQMWTMSPYLKIDTARQFATLQNALSGLRDPARDLGADDADVIVSALKAANGSNEALRSYLETQMAYDMKDVAAWTKQNLPRPAPQDVALRVRDKRDQIERRVVGGVAVGVGLGGLMASLPLGATIVGLFPALALAQVSGSIVGAGVQIMKDPNMTSVVDRKLMPDLMVALLGPDLAKPGARVPFWQFTYRPQNELVMRLRHAALLRNTLIKMGTPELTKRTADQVAVADTAEALYRQDVVVGAMLLSVLSRQMDGGTHVKELSKFVSVLPADQLVPFGQMAEALATSGDAMLGIPVYDQENKADERRREMTYTAAWAQAAVLVRAQATHDLFAGELHRESARVLGADAKIETFQAPRAALTITDARAQTPSEPKAGAITRARDAFKSWTEHLKTKTIE